MHDARAEDLELTEKVDVVVSEWSLGAMEKSSDNIIKFPAILRYFQQISPFYECFFDWIYRILTDNCFFLNPL